MTLLNALRWKLWNGFASSGWLLIILGVSPTVFGQNLVIAPQIVASPSVQIISLETDLRYQEGGAIFFNGVDAGLFDAISTQPVHGRYLWDEAFLGETTSLARYLWDEAKKLNPPPERFLWDEPAAPAGTVARYLWDDSSQSVPTTNRYLWDEATQPGVAIARYLWDERSALPQAPRAKFTPAISDLDRRTAGYLWQDFNRPVQIIEEDKPLKSYLGGKNHLLERNSELQIASSNGSGSHFGAASTVVLAGLDYSARSDAVLKFIDDRVLWSVKNQGQKSFNIEGR